VPNPIDPASSFAPRQHRLPVSGGHVLQVHESGHPDGIAALVLHGGPGSGCTPFLSSFLDPSRYRVICVDQRGAGRSTPRGGIGHNTTADLLADLRRLREQLGIDRWLVVGGSWGATLAIAHAHDAPEAVAALLLRAVFVARPEDLRWFFQDAAALLPQAWDAFASCAPPEHRHALLPWLAGQFAQRSRSESQRLALAWWRWEVALANGGAQAPVEPEGDALDALVDRYRVQSHYLQHGCWLDKPTLLQRCASVPPVPTLLLHGGADRICRPDGAVAVQLALPRAQLLWIDGAGHDPTHPAMAAAMRAALSRYATAGDFDIGA
jgi:proline iminopeptidase